MYFMVPAGVNEISIRVSGDNNAEVVSIALFDPAGKIVKSKANVSKPDLLCHKRENAEKNEIWSLDITKAVEDFNLSILGGAIPILSDSPDKLFIMDPSK